MGSHTFFSDLLARVLELQVCERRRRRRSGGESPPGGRRRDKEEGEDEEAPRRLGARCGRLTRRRPLFYFSAVRVALLHLWAVLVLLTAELTWIDAAEVYTNAWAVQIVAGPEEADRIAREHGFTNLGNVFGDYYHFRHHAVEKRALSGHRGMHIRLQKEPQSPPSVPLTKSKVLWS
ncbi:unnamed protein product [Pleuronectes platessa]|uniref:Peptidase S8 pro-domain domain-containing protein n=1 Tax=Pleuronectes platessa TaxID=8262 RepID=A0A9N7VIA8_PLEPL|nr:unnamed protein product [Pleuronectes platessa]